MKVIKLIALTVCFAMLMSAVCYADEGCNWFIVKCGNKTPRFPDNAEEISKYGAVFLDSRSAVNKEKRLYLTFDAGYENGNIEKILNIMKDEGVTGAFFILSNLIKKNPELIKRMVDEGHMVCNHTSDHKDMTKLSDSEVLSNLSYLEFQYKELTGLEMEKFFRFPEGKYNVRAVKLLYENGYKCVFWSMAYDDWDNSRQMNPEVAKNKLLSTTHDGAVLLLHPTSETNALILRDLIREWKRMGYTFGSLKEI